MLYVDLPSTSLSTQHIGNYYSLQPQLIPEAFPELHQALYAPRGPGERPRRGGCSGLQAEGRAVAGSGRYQHPVVMYREAVHLLMQQVLSRSSQGAGAASAGDEGAAGPVRALLQGAHGSGKSMALAALVERARADGWVALYIPSARALIRGGYFTPRSGAPSLAHAAGAPGAARTTYDTQISAQHILLAMRTAHAQQLGGMRAQTALSGAVLARSAGGAKAKEGATVGDVVEAGLATDTDGGLAVDAALALLGELAALPPSVAPVLLAVDDYNCLYGRTAYGRPRALDASAAGGGDGSEEGQGYSAATRQLLKVTDLTLAPQMRLLDPGMAHALGNAHVVCAVTATASESRMPAAPPLAPGAAVLEVPRLSPVEVAHAVQHYHECGACAQPPTHAQVKQLLTLTAGNWDELRTLVVRAPLLASHNKRAVLSVV